MAVNFEEIRNRDPQVLDIFVVVHTYEYHCFGNTTQHAEVVGSFVDMEKAEKFGQKYEKDWIERHRDDRMCFNVDFEVHASALKGLFD